MDRALRIVAPVVGNAVITEQIARLADRVVEGATLSESLRPHPEIPPRCGIWCGGRGGGALGDLLYRAADAMTRRRTPALRACSPCSSR